MHLYEEFASVMLGAALISTPAYLLVSRRSARSHASRQSVRFSRALDALFSALVLTFFVLFALLDIRQFQAFNNYGFDFAVFDQALWNSLHGRLFESSINSDVPFLLGQHFSLLLSALVPLYAVTRTWVLVVFPALCVAAAAVPLYWSARQQVGRFLALCFALAFFLAPSVQYRALDQYYDVAWGILLFMLAGFFLLRRRYTPLLVCIGLALLAREEMAFVAAWLGIFIAVFDRRVKIGLGLTLASLLWLAFLLGFFMPSLGQREGYYYLSHTTEWGGQHYGYLGSNVTEIVVTLFTRPDVVMAHVLIPEKIEAIARFLMPLGAFCVIGGEVAMLGLPTFGYTLLSDVQGNYTFSSHLYAPALPFLFLGAVVGARRMLAWRAAGANRTARQAALGAFILAASAATYFVDAPGPLARRFEAQRYAVTDHTRLGATLAQTIPFDAVVLAQHEVMPHVSARRYLYVMPGISCWARADYLFADSTRAWYDYYRPGWESLFARAYFEPVVQQDGWILMRYAPRARLEHALDIRFGDGLALVGYTLPFSGTISGGQTLTPYFAWRSGERAPANHTVHIHLADGRGHVWAEQVHAPCRDPRELLWNDDASLRLPPTMPPDEYRLIVSILDTATQQWLEARDSAGTPLGAEAMVATVRVAKNKSSFTASELFIEQPLFVDMREMRFLGYVPPPREIARGEVLPVGVYWRARGKPQGDYLVAVQLRDATGRVAFEHASRPANGAYPTTAWDAGEVLLDWHDLALPRELSGAFQIVVVLREATSGAQIGEAAIAHISIVD